MMLGIPVSLIVNNWY